MPSATFVIGFHLKDNSHWTLYIIDQRRKVFVYVDPLGNEEQDAIKLTAQFNTWSRLWDLNQTVKWCGPYAALTPEHDQQRDATTCGLWCLVFLKRMFTNRDLRNVDLLPEAALLAAEVLSNSDSLQTLCILCGKVFQHGDNCVSCSLCFPRRQFHEACVPAYPGKFACEICDPDPFQVNLKCYLCGELIVLSHSGDITKCLHCPRSIHGGCLPRGARSYDCGVCTR